MTDGIRRTVTESGGSLKVVIPSQLGQMCGIVKGDAMKFEYLGPGELRIKKVSVSK